MDAVPRAAVEEVRLRAARDRVLAQPAFAPDDIVPFARAAMDGFAVHSSDGNGPLAVVAPAFAGFGGSDHARGKATPIATGAMLPNGADAVVCDEDSVMSGGAVSFVADPAPGDHIFPKGEDARSGDLLLSPRRVLFAGDLALLAAAGFARVSVFRRPRVAVLCTGDELVDIARAPSLGQVRDSNGVMLSAAAEASGAEVVCERVIADDLVSIENALCAAFSTCDVILTTGGASRGPRDLVKEACERIGVRFAFTGVAMKPARPTAFGVLGEKRVFVLPGNPAAAFVAWHALGRPYLTAAAMRKPARARRGTLSAGVRGKAGRCVFVLCDVRTTSESFVAVPLENQCSSLVRNASRARGLIMVPLGTEELPAGASVEIEVLTTSGA
jgi:molybdopterin molybdotransferase